MNAIVDTQLDLTMRKLDVSLNGYIRLTVLEAAESANEDELDEMSKSLLEFTTEGLEAVSLVDNDGNIKGTSPVKEGKFAKIMAAIKRFFKMIADNLKKFLGGRLILLAVSLIKDYGRVLFDGANRIENYVGGIRALGEDVVKNPSVINIASFGLVAVGTPFMFQLNNLVMMIDAANSTGVIGVAMLKEVYKSVKEIVTYKGRLEKRVREANDIVKKNDTLSPKQVKFVKETTGRVKEYEANTKSKEFEFMVKLLEKAAKSK